MLHSLTLADVLREHARSWPRQTAAVDGDVRLGYRDLHTRVTKLAHALAEHGVQPGDRLLWMGQNSARILELLLAGGMLGAGLCCVNWRQTAEELAFVLDDLAPAVVVWQEAEIGDAVREARATSRAAASARWLAHDTEQDPYETFLDGGAPYDDFETRDPAETAMLLYTAAFAGTPNAAMLSHQAIITQSLVMAHAADITPEYTYLNSGPMFHLATLMTTFATFVVGGTNVFTPRVDAAELCRLIEAEGCNGAFLMGPTIRQILEVNRDGRYDLKSLRSHAGKPAWTDMTTVDTSPFARNPAGYGQTEVMGMMTMNVLATQPQGSHGRAVPVVQTRIVDPDDREVADGEVGELVARGPTVMNGYWNRPELNDERLRGGWHHTNDLARREPDGSITFIGPKTRLIKSAAENIYPAEVEQALARHPAVAECAIIGVPDPRWTQSVKAIVALREGEVATEHDIIEHVRGQIASYKKPRSVEFVDRLPRNGFAIDYDELDARFGGGGYPGARP
jgi:long-chain acyl-CoA synthetase